MMSWVTLGHSVHPLKYPRVECIGILYIGMTLRRDGGSTHQIVSNFTHKNSINIFEHFVVIFLVVMMDSELGRKGIVLVTNW